MQSWTRTQVLFLGAACLCVGWLIGQVRSKDRFVESEPARNVEAISFPMAARLGSNLYLQTAAEYRACCRGIYRAAETRLETILQLSNPKPAKPAVIMDLDETVLDNSAFQTFLYQNELEYTNELWADYEKNHPQDVTLIPGAKPFIERAEALGVTVVFISNRSQLFQPSTKSVLERLGIRVNPPSHRLILKGEKDNSDKSSRRELVAKKYTVLMLFGDNLRDFSETFVSPKIAQDATPDECRKAIDKRVQAVDDAASHWGIDWIVLPNPVYGEWDRLLGRDPKALLHPTSMKGKVSAAP